MPLTQSEIQERLRKRFGDRSARTGTKGTVLRKFKVVPKASTQDITRLNSQLKRLNATTIPAIEEVNLFKNDGTIIHFTKPKVQAEISSNTYVVQGANVTKRLEELLPDILPQLGGESIEKLKNLAQIFKQANFGASEVPTLVDENFEDVAKRDEKVDTSLSGEKPLTEKKNTEIKEEVDVTSMSTTPAAGNITSNNNIAPEENKTKDPSVSSNETVLEVDLSQAVSV